MPLISYDSEPNAAGYQPIDFGKVQEEAPVSIGQVAGAAFRQENMIGSFWNDKLRGVNLFEKEDDYSGADVWNSIAGTRYERHWDRFAQVQNRRAFAAMQAQIDQEEEDQRTIAAGGWTGFAASAAASLLDPTILLPGGAVFRGGKLTATIGRSALSLGVAGAAGAAVQEAGLQATQQTRDMETSLYSVAGGAILGGLLGAGAGALFSRADLGRLSRMVEDAQQPGFDGATDVLHRELTDMAVGNRSVGAAAAPVDTLDDLSIAGGLAGKVAGATAQLNPMLRTLTSPSRVVRSVAASLMDTPVYLKKNLRGEGEIAAETAMQEWTRGAVAQAVEGQRLTYLEARKTGLRMSESEFRAEVGKAMRRGDKSEFPAVEKVAKEWRARVFEPLKKRAIAAGLLPEDVKVATAESYFSRVYNKEMITARESEFKDIVTRWAEKEIDRSALNSKRVLDAKTLDAQREINDLNMKVQRRETDLQERLQAGEISPDQFDENEVVQFARRVASGERPAMPQRLSEWLRKLQRDGIYC